jgi:hypothetical protein
VQVVIGSGDRRALPLAQVWNGLGKLEIRIKVGVVAAALDATTITIQGDE